MFTIRRFELFPLFELSFALGVAAGLIPSLAATLASVSAVSTARRFLEGLKKVSQPLPAFGQQITFDFVDLLHLSGTLQSLQFIDDRAWFFGSALFVVLALLMAIGLSFATVSAAIVYNVLAKRIRGLRIEVEGPTSGY